MLYLHRSVKISCLENLAYIQEGSGFFKKNTCHVNNLPLFLRILWFTKLYNFPLQVLIIVPYFIFGLVWEIWENYDKIIFDDHGYFTAAAFLRLLSLVTSIPALAFLVKGDSCLLRVKLWGKLKWIWFYILSWLIIFMWWKACTALMNMFSYVIFSCSTAAYFLVFTTIFWTEDICLLALFSCVI